MLHYYFIASNEKILFISIVNRYLQISQKKLSSNTERCLRLLCSTHLYKHELCTYIIDPLHSQGVISSSSTLSSLQILQYFSRSSSSLYYLFGGVVPPIVGGYNIIYYWYVGVRGSYLVIIKSELFIWAGGAIG